MTNPGSCTHDQEYNEYTYLFTVNRTFFTCSMQTAYQGYQTFLRNMYESFPSESAKRYSVNINAKIVRTYRETLLFPLYIIVLSGTVFKYYIHMYKGIGKEVLVLMHNTSDFLKAKIYQY